MRIALLYLVFAIAATFSNLAAQSVTLWLYHGPWAISGSVLVGTFVGLLLKYVLDKHYIFRFHARHAVHDARVFVLYTLTGVLTTGVFWALEAWFHYLFSGDDMMRYLGGALGLGIGYVIKYRLDKRFVFTER